MSKAYDLLSPEGRALLDETMERLDILYDPQVRLLAAGGSGRGGHSVRASAHYALGLLIRGGQEDTRRAAGVIGAVIDTQFDWPGEIYHGTYRRTPQEPHPPRDALPWREISPFARYFMDDAAEKVTNSLRARLQKGVSLRPYSTRIEGMLRQSVLENYPVVWKSYDPNWREFILCAFAMILAQFEAALPEKVVARMLDSAGKALRGAIDRVKSGLTPLNTNIELMHVFALDWFAGRLGLEEARRHALEYAENFWRRYLEFHSVSEFNSPTYYGVDLVAAACWRGFAPSQRIRELGALIEAGLWEDLADTYNHALRNVCGPYSRNYEMDMSRHTSIHALLFLGLGMEAFPERPFNVESDHNPLLILGGPRIPDNVRARLLSGGEERVVVRKFKELSERGDPREAPAVCTAVSWISGSLMTGAMSGSRNVSGQLHPATVHWRDEAGGVSSMRLQRSGPEGNVDGFHLVLFDCRLDRNRLAVDVDCRTNRDIKVYFEFESPLAETAKISRNCWEFGILIVKVDPEAPEHFLQREGNRLRVCFLAETVKPETQRMHFELEFILSAQNGRL